MFGRVLNTPLKPLHSWDPPFINGGGGREGVEFSKFSKKGGVPIFSIKREGLVK